jgi:Protein of unknown function, DUF599
MRVLRKDSFLEGEHSDYGDDGEGDVCEVNDGDERSIAVEMDRMDDESGSVRSSLSRQRSSSLARRPRIRRSRYRRAPERMIASVLRLLNRQHVHFSLGMRSLYMTLPCAMWFISNWWFIGTTILVVVLLALNDHIHGLPGLISLLLSMCCRPRRAASTSLAAADLTSAAELSTD